MDTWIWIAIAGAVVVAVFAFVLVTARSRRRARTERLRTHFGPEYDHTLETLRDRRSAETELEARLERREQLAIRPLDEDRRATFRETWQEIQSQFVETPIAAVGSANGLVVDVMRERGYPIEDFDQRAADISVDHPEVVEHYRAARDIVVRMDQGQADTEELRTAMVHVGALLDELLVAEPAQPVAAAQPAAAIVPETAGTAPAPAAAAAAASDPAPTPASARISSVP